MSKGIGKLQRAILEQLKRGDLHDAIAMAAAIHGREWVTEAEAVGVRRALRALEKAGLVTCIGHGFTNGRKRWATPEVATAYLKRVKAMFDK